MKALLFQVADGTDRTRLGGKAGDEVGGTWSTEMSSVRRCPDLGLAPSSCSTTRKDHALDLEPALL